MCHFWERPYWEIWSLTTLNLLWYNVNKGDGAMTQKAKNNVEYTIATHAAEKMFLSRDHCHV